MRILRRSDQWPAKSRSPVAPPVCGTPAAVAAPDAHGGGSGTVDPVVVATGLAHLMAHLPGAREVLTGGNGLSVEFTAELTARGFIAVDPDGRGHLDLENLFTGAAGDLVVVAALAAVLSVPEQYFLDDAVAAQFDDDLDLLDGWLDYRNSGFCLQGNATSDTRADLQAVIDRFRETD